MPQRSGVSGPPNSYLSSGDWPDGKLEGGAPVAVRYARAISRRLRDATEDDAISRVAEEAGIVRSTVHDILAGRTWPDVVSLAKLESTLGTRLWPDLEEISE